MKKAVLLAVLAGAAMLMPAKVSAQGMNLPVDTAVRVGKLANGLTYYVRHNALPEGRAHFYIAQRVGSVQEDESQRGLAHFLEHMCFNGTDNFEGNDLIKYCESIGVKFGVNLNAFTSTDETVYNIDDVPVGREQTVDSCLLILRDWAGGLTLDPKEIDKERGVIREEWRLRSSATQRIFERNLETLYPGSRYGKRMPIGLMSVIDNFKPEALRAYYKKWYRPDLQGVIVVGDIDPDKVEASIERIFGSLPMPENAAKYETYPVPDNNTPIYVVDKDKEVQQGVIDIFFKSEAFPDSMKNSIAYTGMQYLQNVACGMMNARFNELSMQPDCPYLGAMVRYTDYLLSKTKAAVELIVVPKPGQDTAALRAAMAEVVRARRFGFTDTEYGRMRDELMSQLEEVYTNRTKQYNAFYTQQYVDNFLDSEPIPSVADEFTLLKRLTPVLPVAAASELFGQLVARTDTNFVLLAMYPEAEGTVVPTADALKAAVDAAASAPLTAYVDNVNTDPFVTELPQPGKITAEAPAAHGYTCWTLSNGARVFYRQTDFNDSEVLLQAVSKGGTSRVDDKDLANMKFFNEAIRATGVGPFSATELMKKLAGKQVSVTPALGYLSDNLSGSATPKDLRTLFELTYLRFQGPADDPDGFNNAVAFKRSELENADKNPQLAWSDSLQATLYGHNPRQTRLTLGDLGHVTYDGIKQIYRERFASAGDFDFFFTGAFNVDSLRAYTEQYIASLPGVGERETWTDRKQSPVTGVHDNRFTRQMETPQGFIGQIWSGKEKLTMKSNLVAQTLGQVLTARYLESIREKGGMAYTVQAMASVDRSVDDRYSVVIVCPVKPEKADSALLLMRQAIDDIARNGVTAEELDKVKKYELKTYADSQRQNGYWQGAAVETIEWDNDPVTGFKETVEAITSADVQAFVRDVVLKQGNCVTVTMLPATK